MAEYVDKYAYNLESTLGQGAFGIVYLITSKEDRNQKYAFKVINLTKASREDVKVAQREADILSKLNHEHIIKHIESFAKGGALCIMTEYCDRGNLQNFLEERGKIKLEENRIALWLKQICSGLEYMHKRNLMHRDVKAENIFLSGENLTAKLGDLGLVKVLESPSALAMTFCGSPYYMSPDILSHHAYDQKTDIWALGVIVYELATLGKPFDATSMYSLVNKVVNGELPPMPEKDYSEGLIKLMKKMLCKKPGLRPSAMEILGDAYFKPKRPLPEPPKPSEQNQGGKKGNLSMTIRGNQESFKQQWAAERVIYSRFDVSDLVGTLTLVQRRRKGLLDVTLTDVDFCLDDVPLEKSVIELPQPMNPNNLMRSVVHSIVNQPQKQQEQPDLVSSDSCRGELYYKYQIYVYCEHGCCGYAQEPRCCTTSFETIVGAIFGGLFFIGILLVSIVCFCSKRSQKCVFIEPVGVIQVRSPSSVVYDANTESCQIENAVVIKPPPYSMDPPPEYTPNPCYI